MVKHLREMPLRATGLRQLSLAARVKVLGLMVYLQRRVPFNCVQGGFSGSKQENEVITH
jgi:hypothetical protein